MRAATRLWVALLLAAAAPCRSGAVEPGGEPLGRAVPAQAPASRGRVPAYLVYAVPYSSSPSSAFGHLFLVLADEAGDPPPLWRVVTFNAVTFDVDPLRYLTIGVAGGFLGRFDRFAFHEKTREYELLDDRDLWLLELRLAPSQRADLEGALDRARGWYPYSFFELNCAYYLQALLSDATGAVARPSGVVSPTGVFAAVERSGLGGTAYHRPSASRRIAALSEDAAPPVRRRLRDADWEPVAADAPWLSRLTRPERALAQEVFALRALQATSVLPAETREGLARLRLMNAEPWPEAPEISRLSGPGLPIPSPEFHRYPRLRLLYAAPDGPDGRVYLKLRGAMHDEADPWLGHRPANTMELLSLEVSSSLARPGLRLESAVLFSQRSLTAPSFGREQLSWLVEALARRGGVLGEDALHVDARAGLGKTVELPAETYLHALVTLAATGVLGEGAAVAPGFEVGLVSLVGSRWRFGGTWAREHDLLDWSRSAQRFGLWTRFDLGRRWGVIASADLRRAESTLRLGMDFYP